VRRGRRWWVHPQENLKRERAATGTMGLDYGGALCADWTTEEIETGMNRYCPPRRVNVDEWQALGADLDVVPEDWNPVEQVRRTERRKPWRGHSAPPQVRLDPAWAERLRRLGIYKPDLSARVRSWPRPSGEA